MIPAFWYHGFGNWDCAFPRFIVDKADSSIQHVDGLTQAHLFPSLKAIIFIPGRHSAGPEHYEAVNRAAANFDKVLFFIFGDEEGIFHADRLDHAKKKVWWAMPPLMPKQEVDRVTLNGWPLECREMIVKEKEIVQGARDLDWSFMGQMTHRRRIECVDATQGLPRGRLLATPGFTEGVSRREYYRTLCRSKIVLCPSGPCTPDSFRFAEALEANCIPIVDELTQNVQYPSGYWQYVTGCTEFPFPVVKDWSVLHDCVERILLDYAHCYPACIAWWSWLKMKYVEDMKEDLST